MWSNKYRHQVRYCRWIQVSFAEYSLFYRALLQKKPVFLGSYEKQRQTSSEILSVAISPHNTDTMLYVCIVGLCFSTRSTNYWHEVYCRSLFLHTIQTQCCMSALSVCVSPRTPPITDMKCIVGRYFSTHLCRVRGEIQTKHLCGEIKTEIESDIVRLYFSTHLCWVCG